MSTSAPGASRFTQFGRRSTAISRSSVFVCRDSAAILPPFCRRSAAEADPRLPRFRHYSAAFLRSAAVLPLFCRCSAVILPVAGACGGVSERDFSRTIDFSFFRGRARARRLLNGTASGLRRRIRSGTGRSTRRRIRTTTARGGDVVRGRRGEGAGPSRAGAAAHVGHGVATRRRCQPAEERRQERHAERYRLDVDSGERLRRGGETTERKRRASAHVAVAAIGARWQGAVRGGA